MGVSALYGRKRVKKLDTVGCNKPLLADFFIKPYHESSSFVGYESYLTASSRLLPELVMK